MNPGEAPKGKFTASDLIPGKRYRVVAPFADYDGITHQIGETWTFQSKSFLPYEDGLTLFVDREGSTVQLRLQWRPETQGKIIDQFSDLVEEL